MTTEKGVWNIQQVRDKQLQSAWKTYSGEKQLYMAGRNSYGGLGQNQAYPGLNPASSPVQVPGIGWK